MMGSLQGTRIVVLFGSLEMGGAERQGLLLARYLHDTAGAEVAVWGLGAAHGPVAAQCDQWGIPWKALALHWGLVRRIPHLLRLGRQLRRFRPAILIPYTKVPNLAAALLGPLCGARLVLWNQADAGLLMPDTLLHRLAIRRAGWFAANAAEGAVFLKERFKAPAERIRVIPNGVALAEPGATPDQWRQRLAAGTGQLLTVMLANLSSYKDHATLLSAWAELCRGRQGELPLLALAGRFDDQTAALRQQAVALGIEGQLRFLGSVADVAGLLYAADLLVHSSRSEGIPNAVLEGMAAGLAVVASDLPGIREALGREGENGLVPAGDAPALARKLAELLKDEPLRRRIGADLAARAAQQYGVERMCRESVEWLEHCLEGQACRDC